MRQSGRGHDVFPPYFLAKATLRTIFIEKQGVKRSVVTVPAVPVGCTVRQSVCAKPDVMWG
ncbi:MAG: hypothetical protein CMO05_02065 [Thalassospira sp.]|nr:hypothetical protein [Thalassospira sp.]